MSAVCRRLLLAMALALTPLIAAAQAQAVDPTLTVRARQAIRLGDIEELERLHAEVRASKARDASGQLGLEVLRRTLDRQLDGPGGAIEAYFAEVEAFTLQWAQARPRSSLAHAMHLAALTNRAWYHRGTGYANTVPPHAWRDFTAVIERAAKYAAAHAEVLRSDSTAYPVLLNIARASGAPLDRLVSIGIEGLERNPEDHTIYQRVMIGLLPKWGGDARSVERWIREAETRTRAAYGKALYALLYAEAADQEFEHALFEQSLAEWRDLREGFRDVLARWPTPEHVNRFAYFACLARDQDTWHELVERVGTEPLLRQWGSNPRQMYDSCKRWASRQ